MKTKVYGLLTIAVAIVLSVPAMSQESAAPAGHKSVGDVLNEQLSIIEKNVTSLADAVPDDKYNFVPSGPEFKTVRSFGGQIKHLATANYMLGSGILGEEKPIQTKGPDGPENIKTKAEIQKFLADSYTYLRKALDSVNEKNMTEPIKNPFGLKDPWTRLGLATLVIAHEYDHYGQAVIFARMNGIVPPASRPQK